MNLSKVCLTWRSLCVFPLALFVALGAPGCSEKTTVPSSDLTVDIGGQPDSVQSGDAQSDILQGDSMPQQDAAGGDLAQPDAAMPDAGQPDAAHADLGGAVGLWAVGVGGSDPEHVNIGLEVDSADNSYVAGNFKSASVSFGSTTLTLAAGSKGNNGFLAKLDPLGKWVWASSFSATANLGIGTSALDSAGNHYVSGDFKESLTVGSLTHNSVGKSDIFLIKADSRGVWLWSTTTKSKDSSSATSSTSVVVDSAGNSYLSGEMEQTVSFGTTTLSASGRYIYVAKLDSAGNWVWAKLVQGSAPTKLYRCNGTAIDSKGDILITGAFEGSIAFGTTTLSSTNLEMFVAKIDNTGSWKWATAAQGSTDISPSVVVADSSDNVLVSGCLAGSTTFGATTLKAGGSGYNAYIAQLSSAGVWQWAASAPSTTGGCIAGHTVDSMGNSYVTGDYVGAIGDTAAFGTLTLTLKSPVELFVAKVSPSGNWLSLNTAQGTSNKFGGDVALNSAGVCHVAGGFKGAGTFGTTPLTSNGDNDIFIWQTKL